MEISNAIAQELRQEILATQNDPNIIRKDIYEALASRKESMSEEALAIYELTIDILNELQFGNEMKHLKAIIQGE